MKKEIITPIDAPEAFTVEAAEERRRKKAEQHPPVMRALGLAYYWQSLIESGKFDSISAIAAAEGLSKARVSQITQLLRLSPARVHSLMRSPRSIRKNIPVCWDQQQDRMV